MNAKPELDAVGSAIAVLVRQAETVYANLEASGPPDEDPDALSRAKRELEAARHLEKDVAKCYEVFAKADKTADDAAREAREKAEKEAKAAHHSHEPHKHK
jgi:hypothetical protein